MLLGIFSDKELNEMLDETRESDGLDRGDRLKGSGGSIKFLEILLTVVIIGLLLTLVIGVIFTVSKSAGSFVNATADVDEIAWLDITDTREEAQVDRAGLQVDDQIEVRVPITSGLSWILLAMAVPAILGPTVALHKLRTVVRQARFVDPFLPANANRLSTAGWIFIALAAYRFLIDRVVESLLSGRVAPVSVELPAALPTIEYLVGGLGLLAVAQVFIRGIAYRTFEAQTI